MDDLISRKDLIERLETSHAYHARNSREEVLLHRDIHIIKEQPPVDAVEVVRCKDCKHWHEDDDIGHCDNPDGLDNYSRPDDFCSYGERKEKGDDRQRNAD